MTPPLKEAYDALLNHFGPQHWWPAESNLEMMIGAILTQNTAWANVEKAIDRLRAKDALAFDTLQKVSREALAEWIRPAGYFNQKAEYIKAMIHSIDVSFSGSLDQLFSLDTPALRKELLSWKGIGPETADSIILYAAKRPVFVVDAYTRRICTRHGWLNENAKYDETAQLFTENLPVDEPLFNEYHALIVRLCKAHCTARNPTCATCPLKYLLP